jgi:hypothetical protein
VATGSPKILTNAIATNSGTYDYATYDLVLYQYQKIKVTMLQNSPPAGKIIKLSLRCADNGSQDVSAVFTTNQVLIYVTATQQGATAAFPFVIGDIIEFALIGNNVLLYKNGVLALTRALVTLVPLFYKALVGSNMVANTRFIDDFSVYNLFTGPYIGSWILRLTDTFSRPNENPLAAPWVTLLGPAALRIVSQEVRGTGAGVHNISLLTHPSIGQDQRVDLTIRGSVGNVYGVILRFNPGPNSGYYIVLDPQFNSWQVNTYVGGATANLVNGAIIGGGVATNCVLRAEVNDNTISVYVNNILQVSFLNFTFSDAPNTATGIYTSGTLPAVDNYKIYYWNAGATRRNRRHRGGELWGIIPEVAPYLG